jgi:D-beta-D-heptose 7-phosphate kinase / D-beta-D-heptose 1-phosphate adenosyltransferase
MRGASPIVVIGDAVLDRDLEGRAGRLCPDAPVPVVDQEGERPRAGGAGLAAALAARGGREVVLVTALASDPAADELRSLLAAAGVAVVDLGLAGDTPEKVRVRVDGRTLLRVDRGGPPGRVGPATAEVREALAGAGAVLVSDYGRGVAAERALRTALGSLPASVALVWDPHPRGPEPVVGARLVTPNAVEAAVRTPEIAGDGLAAASRRAAALARRWRADGVVVTLGERGAVYAAPGLPPLAVPAPSVRGGDPCGAGDCFAAAAAALLADGALVMEAVAGAVEAASAFVAAGGAARAPFGRRTPPSPREEWPSAPAAIARMRATGRTVVAAGGCFDLLHAGHVRMLEAARALGDCLVVLLNSDASVRRIKGPDRPLVDQADRAAVLAALACVDAVEIFDEDTPVAALGRLRPDIFAKGADYAVADLPEAAAMAALGGQAVVLPYVAGRSTTRLIQEAVSRVGI